jgi:sugar phosphate isomerase/epimerase
MNEKSHHADNNMSRRRILMAGGALLSAGALSSLSACSRGGESAKAVKQVGIQLYTVRNQLETDFRGTLQKLADIGYREFEFHSYFGNSPSDVKKMVADMGVSAPSAHMNPIEIRDKSQQFIDDAAEAGHKFALVAWLPPDQRATIDDYKMRAAEFNRYGEMCKKAGMRFAYHNHDFEFIDIDGQTPWDVIFTETDPSLVEFELDMFWAVKAGKSVQEILARAPERYPLCHIKDMGENGDMVDVGAGTIDFASILADKKLARFEHEFVENDNAPDPIHFASVSYENMLEILKESN